jgi:Mrp family chromosome partitioning ATPase
VSAARALALVIVFAATTAAVAAIATLARPERYSAEAVIAARGSSVDALLNGGFRAAGRFIDSADAEPAAGSALNGRSPKALIGAAEELAQLESMAELAAQRSGTSLLTVDRFADDIHVSVRRPSGLLVVRGMGSDPGQAAHLANTYASTVTSYVNDGVAARLSKAKQSIDDQLAQVRTESSALTGDPRIEQRLSEASSAVGLLLSANSLQPPLELIAEAAPSGGAETPPVAGVTALAALGGALLAGLLLLLRVLLTERRRRWGANPEAELQLPVLAELRGARAGFRMDPRRATPGERQLSGELARILGTEDRVAVGVVSTADAADQASVAWTLAALWGYEGHSVLLFETDSRNPRLAAAYSLDSARGLERLLDEDGPSRSNGASGDRVAEALLREVTQPIPLPGGAVVDVLVAGDNAGPADLAGSEQFAAAVRAARQSYRRVVADLPTGRLAAPIAAHLGSAILVAHLGRVSAASVRRQARRLRAKSVDVIGIVVLRDDVARSWRGEGRPHPGAIHEDEPAPVNPP